MPVSLLLVVLAATSAPVAAGAAGDRGPTGASERYHADPGHPWNRLHAALARRTTGGGREVGLEESDLLLWPGSTYLLEDERIEELLVALEAFAAAEGDGWIDAPLARVLMQQDLWQAFDWCVAGLSEEPASWSLDEGRLAEQPRRRLARALARALARGAPTADALAGLPDNLAEAVEAWQGARAPDAARPREPFLPDVEWVRLGDASGRAAPLAILHAETFAGRAAFEVRVAVPGGRAATLAWLATLSDSGEGTVACDGSACGAFDERAGKHHLHLSPGQPPPPPGTVVALVRRMVAFDEAGQLHVTPLVESVQLRGFLEAPEDALDARPWEPPAGWPWQAVAEFELEPARLLAGAAGGLRPIRPGEHAFVFLGSHGDPFAHLPDDFDAAGAGRHLDSCVACHGIVGALSLVSFTRIASGPGTQLSVPLREFPPRLVEVDARADEARTLRFKRERFDWGLLWSLLAEERARR